MKTKSRDQLVKSLILDLAPVNPVILNYKYILFALLVGLFSVIAGVCMNGIRFDYASVVYSSRFLFEGLLLGGIAILATASAFVFSTPHIKYRNYPLAISILISTWLIVLGLLVVLGANFRASWGFACFGDVFLNSLAPAAIIFYFVRKAAPLNRPLVGWMSLTAGAAFGAIATQFSCYVSEPSHVLLWHALPMCLIGMTGLFLGQIIFKKL